jgi:MFS family permease
MRSRLAVLRERNFRQLYIGQSVSVLGDGLTPVALTFAVLDLTGSATDLGLVLAAQGIPLAGLALVGGVWADRLRREWVMLASDLIRAAVQAIAAILLLAGWAHLWHLIALAATYGAAEAFFRPAAGGLMPQVAPLGRLQDANALRGLSENFGWLVGPAIAGGLIAVLSPGGVIAIDSATFLVSAAFLATLRVPRLERTAPPAGFVRELRDGWREVRSRTWLWVNFIRVSLALFLIVGPFYVLAPVVIRQSAHNAASIWGLIMAAFSLGMLIGGVGALRWRPKRPLVAVCLLSVWAGWSPAALALGLPFWVLNITELVHGLAIGLLVPIWDTTLQSHIPPQALARVTAWDWMSSLALLPLGFALVGPLSQVIGIDTTLWISASCSMLGLFTLFVRDIWRVRSRV